jgi:hypothetical protein
VRCKCEAEGARGNEALENHWESADKQIRSISPGVKILPKPGKSHDFDGPSTYNLLKI